MGRRWARRHQNRLSTQSLAFLLPAAQRVFGTVALSATELAGCLLAATLLLWAVETEK